MKKIDLLLNGYQEIDIDKFRKQFGSFYLTIIVSGFPKARPCTIFVSHIRQKKYEYIESMNKSVNFWVGATKFLRAENAIQEFIDRILKTVGWEKADLIYKENNWFHSNSYITNKRNKKKKTIKDFDVKAAEAMVRYYESYDRFRKNKERRYISERKQRQYWSLKQKITNYYIQNGK